MVRSTTRMSCGAVGYNNNEAWFQIYGRLVWYAKRCERQDSYIGDRTKGASTVSEVSHWVFGIGRAALDLIMMNVYGLCSSQGRNVICD